jgi:hypothetical protein
MAYASWTVAFGEQPSAAKWNILGTNDASFNDGTGIFGLKKDLLATDSNPYKFSAYLAANQTGIADSSFTKVVFDTERFDTNSNFATGTYTAPVTGFYQINTYLISTFSGGTTGVTYIAAIYVNGAEVRRSDAVSTGGVTFATMTSQISDIIQLTATNTVDVYVYSDVGSGTTNVVSGAFHSRFSGYLVSRT